MQERQTDILIAGGGIAGLTLGILLAEAGIQTVLIDPAPPQKHKISGRTVALMQTSLNIIKGTTIWPSIEHSGTAMKTMRIIDANGRDILDAPFDAEDLDLTEFGYNIPNHILRNALYEKALKTANLTLHMPARLSGYTVTGQTITAEIANDESVRARLIVGADGRNSAVRKIAGIEVQEHKYDQCALTCLIRHTQPHNNIATEFHRPGGPLAFVPLPGQVSSVVWVEKTEKAEALTRLRKADFEKQLQEAGRNILGRQHLESPLECWPLCTIKARRLTAPRAALIAEAAHVMSPITAQGLNLSLRDVAAMAEIIVDAMRLGLDPGAATVLQHYESRRRLDIETRVRGVDGMNRIVSNDWTPVKALRRGALKVIEEITPLKKFAMRQGLAPQIDLGRLAKGERL